MIDLINPPAIVRHREEEHDATYWHEENIEANNQRELSSLRHSEALYHLNEDNKVKQLGYADIYEYTYKVLNRSRSWSTAMINIHKKCVIELGLSKDLLKAATFGKIAKVVSHLTPENADNILSNITKMTQQEVGEYVKELQNSDPRTEETDEEKEEQKTFKVKGPASMVEVIETAVSLAKDNIFSLGGFYKQAGDISDVKALEFVAASFLSGVDLDGNAMSSLKRSLDALESVYNVKIQWEQNDE